MKRLHVGRVVIRVDASDELRVEPLELVVELLLPDAGRENHQASQRADDQGVDEGFEQGDHSLGDRLVGARRGVGDGGGPLPRFVGEQAAVDAAIHRVGDACAQEAAGGRRTREGVLEDGKERRQHFVEIGGEHGECADGIENAHRRDDCRRHPSDPLDAADDDEAQEQRQDAAAQPMGDAEGGGEAGCHAVRLGHVAGTESAYHRRQCEQHRQPFEVRFLEEGSHARCAPALEECRQGCVGEAAFHVVHRPAGDFALVVRDAVFVRNGHLHELRGHANERGGPHPEQRRRPAEMNGQRHAGDVAGADRAGKRRRKRLKVGGVPGGVLARMTPEQDAPSAFEVAHLGEAEVERKEQAHTQQDDGKVRRRAKQRVESAEDVSQRVHVGWHCPREGNFQPGAWTPCCSPSTCPSLRWQYSHPPVPFTITKVFKGL